jgi:hypothetical protein
VQRIYTNTIMRFINNLKSLLRHLTNPYPQIQFQLCMARLMAHPTFLINISLQTIFISSCISTFDQQRFVIYTYRKVVPWKLDIA